MDQSSLIYRFLLSPNFRIWRFLCLAIFFTIISLNQALVGYADIVDTIGNKVYFIVIGDVIFYIISVYVACKIMVKCLSSGNYIHFTLCIILCAVIYTALSNIIYDSYVGDYDFFSEIIIVDNISAFIIYILCISGVIIPVFIKNWMVSNQHLNQLKIKQESSQIEQLKEQINPSSFFKILNKSRGFVKSDPEKASTMLMKLSQLLRYQLYDCNMKQVLLTAEVSFLRNFMELESLYSAKFDYSISTSGDIQGIFIPPSILLPYAQSVINALHTDKEYHSIDIHINIQNNAMNVIIKISDISSTLFLKKELLNVKDRLNTLYKGRYMLTVTNDALPHTIQVVLTLEK